MPRAKLIGYTLRLSEENLSLLLRLPFRSRSRVINEALNRQLKKELATHRAHTQQEWLDRFRAVLAGAEFSAREASEKLGCSLSHSKRLIATFVGSGHLEQTGCQKRKYRYTLADASSPWE